MRIIVVGAGPAGLFYSINASCLGHEVVLLESNEKAGKKLFITGKGRCNVTNACEGKEFLNNVVTNAKFLFSSLSKWNSFDTIDFFNSHNCPLVIERGNRVFPKSYKAYDITDTLVRECRKNGVSIKFNTKVLEINKINNEFVVKTNFSNFTSDALVIATGGKSYSQTGSKGDGYLFAKKFNHTIIDPVPALCPIKVKENFQKEMLNFTLKNVTLKATSGKFENNEFGDLEFLSNALTGPIALTTSSLINRFDDVTLSIDFKPALSDEQLDNRLLREIKNYEKGTVLDLIKKVLPSAVIPMFLSKLDVDQDESLVYLTKENRYKIVNLIKSFPFSYAGLDNIDRAIVTSGGVDIKQINPKTMESKLVPNLYFIGEVLDIDAFTGGFNIQIALSTAYSAANALKE